jgi:hypothetical protein
MLLEMKVPGAGVLEFDIDDQGDGHRSITITAYFHPAGVWGLLYWFAVLPFHAMVFRGMTSEVARRASAPVT